MNNPNYYINNAQFCDLLKEYKADCLEAENCDLPLPRIPEKIGEAFLLIVTRLSSRGNFSGYTYKEEMVGDAIENCIVAAHNFDPSKSQNPFAYFTQIAWYAFLRRIEKEKKQTYVKYKAYENAVIEDEMFSGSSENYQSNGLDISNEKMIPILEKYNKKATPKKRKKKLKGVEKFINEE